MTQGQIILFNSITAKLFALVCVCVCVCSDKCSLFCLLFVQIVIVAHHAFIFYFLS